MKSTPEINFQKSFQKHLWICFFTVFIFSIASFANGATDLQIPTIAVYPDVYYPFEEVLYIEGSGPPKSTLELDLQKTGAKPRRFSVKTDTRGEWSFAEKIPLEEGDWEVRARTVENELVSDWSNPRIIKVISSGITIGNISIQFAFLTFVIIGLIIIGGIIALYFGWRVRRLRALLFTKEVREAKESVRMGLAGLRKEFIDELRLLSGKPLSQEELLRKERIFSELDRIEHAMEKEIEDIEEKR